MKTLLKYLLLYIILFVLFFGSLLLVSFIPKEAIEKNVRKSAEIMVKEGERIFTRFLGRTIFYDNSTDAIMVNLTYTIDEENRLESIIKARRNFVPGVTEEIKNDMVGDLPYESDTYLMTNELLNTVNNQKQVSYEYARYWHGYIVILRILLLIFDVTAIRWILQIILFISIGVLSYYLNKNRNWKIAIFIPVVFIATDLFQWVNTIQGMFVMIIAVIISVFIANKKINKKNINTYLFVSGALVAYFDFLTTPLVTVLLPIIIYTVVNETMTVKKEIIRLIKNLIAWGFGYLGLWMAKWIVADLLYNMEMMIISIVQIYYRIGGEKVRIVEIEGINGLALLNNVINSINIVSIEIYSLLLIYAIDNRIKNKKNTYLTSSKFIYVICIALTLLWYYVVSEHSFQHYFFTYKTMLIPLLATMLIVCDDRKDLIEKIEKREIQND